MSTPEKKGRFHLPLKDGTPTVLVEGTPAGEGHIPMTLAIVYPADDDCAVGQEVDHTDSAEDAIRITMARQ